MEKIDFETDREVLRDALNKWGAEIQELIAIEEMAELTKALIKNAYREDKRGANVPEEIADVQIMLWQLSEIHGRQNVQGYIEYKLQKLASKLEA